MFVSGAAAANVSRCLFETEQSGMLEVEYYRSKVSECLRLAEANTDPLCRDVYNAMANEFIAKAARVDTTWPNGDD